MFFTWTLSIMTNFKYLLASVKQTVGVESGKVLAQTWAPVSARKTVSDRILRSLTSNKELRDSE